MVDSLQIKSFKGMISKFIPCYTVSYTRFTLAYPQRKIFITSYWGEKV
jgi:hypothetical protein